VLLRLVEVANEVVFELQIRSEDALDAFNHPYAYLPEERPSDPALFAG
jgi:hypothetical protein